MLSPVVPHLTEEIYQTMYAEVKGYKSLQSSPWPKFNEASVDERAEKRGDMVVELISEVRREKAEKRMSLNTPVKKLTVYATDQSGAEAINDGKRDICGALKVEQLEILAEEGSGKRSCAIPNNSLHRRVSNSHSDLEGERNEICWSHRMRRHRNSPRRSY